MRKIPLGCRSGPQLFALVDDEDYEMVTQYSWHALHAERTYYARTAYKNAEGVYETALMHRMILGLQRGERGPDHKNRCGWDNRKENLDMIHNSDHDQMLNRRIWGKSEYRGVSLFKASPKNGRKTDAWRAYYYDGLTAGGNPKQVHLGYFDDEVDAAIAFDNEMAKIGRVHLLNFPLESVMRND